MKPNWQNRTLFHHDNLAVLRGMNSESVDLIATDPPFNKSKDFHATPDSLAAGASFQDRWSWEKDVHQDWIDQITDDYPRLMEAIESARYAHSDGMGAFMCFMAVRLLEMRRVLKPTGSIYLHCDPTASHYLKAVMDAIFRWRNFRNQIVWQRTFGAKLSQHEPKVWGRSSDILLFYAKTPTVSVRPYRALSAEEANAKFVHADEKGRYFTNGLTLFRRPAHGPRPNLCYEWRGFTNPHPSGWALSKERLEEEYRLGNVVITDEGKIERRKYETDYPGVAAGSVWTDIPNLTGTDAERTGYPTQKPLELYERLIRASSNEGDVVLDPFAGCATTLVTAERLGRQWIGIDIWDNAKAVVLQRLEREGLIGEASNKLHGHLFAEDVHFLAEPPARTDDGEPAAPFLRPKVKVFEPRGPKMSRAAMYRHLLGQHGPKCQGCDRVFDDPRYLDLDHNSPRSDGGINHISNRILLCGPCNRLKSNTLTLSGLRKENKKRGYMAGSEGEHPLMREVREERESAPPSLFD